MISFRLSCRLVGATLLLTLFGACATNRMPYRTSSGPAVPVRISQSVKLPATIPVNGLAAAWGALLSGGASRDGTSDEIAVLPPLEDKLRGELLACVTAAIRADPRFRLDPGASQAEFQFEISNALLTVDSGFSTDLKPLVFVTGRLVASNGSVLWKYQTEFQQSRDVPFFDSEGIQANLARQEEALRAGIQHACEDMMEHLRRR